MRILIIGSGGMLGHMTTLYLAEKGYDVYDISKTRKCRKETVLLDVCNTATLSEFLNEYHFDIVINCAALLVRASERNPKAAELLNAEIPHWLEKFFDGTSTRVIQVSTAGVFHGDHAPYSEMDICDAKGCYHGTKRRGELVNQKDLTVRSDFWGPDMSDIATGLFHWVMTTQGEVAGFSNVVINGVSSLEFAHFIEKIIHIPISGIYHLHSKKSISKADLLRKICNIYGRVDIQIRDVSEPRRNTSLVTIREYSSYHHKGYEQQLDELKEWIENHRQLYPHYEL